MIQPAKEDLVATMRRLKICVLLPTYNNSGTLAQVISKVLEQADDVIVVNDGSTDDTEEVLNRFGDKIIKVSYPRNRGKGHALKTGFKEALARGYEYAITIDTDGQHYPEDIPVFVKAISENNGALIVGARDLSGVDINGKSSFANKFSNFWFTVHTGRKLRDTQTGYRAYPLKKTRGMNVLTSRYEAELELLVLTSWHDVDIVSVPIRVYYPPQSERVSHFRPAKDFTRISILNTLFTVLAIVYGYPLFFTKKFLHKNLLKREFTPFTRKNGEKRRANITINRLARSIYSLSHFIFWSSFVFKPYVFFSFRLTKGNETKRQRLHSMLQSISKFFSDNFPGGKATVLNTAKESFEKPAIIIANHQSHLDLPIILSVHKKLIFLTNDWVWNNRFFGKVIQAAEFLPVTDGFEHLKENLKRLKDKGYSIVVFPEGSRSETCKISRFHQGAFALAEALDMDIVPMVIHGAGNFLPKKDFMLRKNPQTLKILPRVKRREFAHLPLLKQASFFKKIIDTEFRELIKNETPEFHIPYVKYKYAYTGWKNVARSKRELKIYKRNEHLSKPNSGVVYFFNPGTGAIPMLYALVNKDTRVVACIENHNDFELLGSMPGLPSNLEVRKIVWDSDFSDIAEASTVFVIENEAKHKHLNKFNPVLIK